MDSAVTFRLLLPSDVDPLERPADWTTKKSSYPVGKLSPARRDITSCTSRLPRCHCAGIYNALLRQSVLRLSVTSPPPLQRLTPLVATLRHYYFAYPVSPLPTARATYERPPSPRPTGLAPRRLGTHSSPPLLRSIYLLQCFPHLSPPPSELRLGRVLRRLDRVLTVANPSG